MLLLNKKMTCCYFNWELDLNEFKSFEFHIICIYSFSSNSFISDTVTLQIQCGHMPFDSPWMWFEWLAHKTFGPVFSDVHLWTDPRNGHRCKCGFLYLQKQWEKVWII